MSHAFYQAFGTDSNSAIVRQIAPGASPELKISAQMAAIELSRDADWLRYRFSAFYASGDDGSDPGTAKGFDTITDNPNLAGGQFMYWSQQKSAVAAGRIAANHFREVQPAAESALEVRRSRQLREPGVDARERRRRHAVVAGAEARDQRLAAAVRRRDDPARRWPAPSPGFEDNAIGIDVGFGAKYRPLVNENMFLVFGYSMLLPQGGFKSAIGSSGRLHSFVGAVQLAY